MTAPAAPTRVFVLPALASLSLWLLAGPLASAQTSSGAEGELEALSLEQLANVEVTSVSKTAERLSRAPAAIYVITHDQIIRSGATSLAQALRLAPNLQVRRLTSTSYAVSARGFGGNQGDQNFANKLLGPGRGCQTSPCRRVRSSHDQADRSGRHSGAASPDRSERGSRTRRWIAGTRAPYRASPD